MLKIHEIFKSIQGESSHTGLPCVFVRLTGCNLRCTWCDTEYAFYEGKGMTIEDVVDAVDQFGISLVEITGGEPLMQKEAIPLMQTLLGKNYTVMLETGGALPINEVPEQVVKIMDLKCPGSGEESKNNYENLRHLTLKDEVKFVILDREDYDWSKKILNEYSIHKNAQVLFSPVYEKLDLKDLAQWILEDNLPVRLQTQLHKVIWSKDAIGV
ncbi:MAG: radical SAM protein [Nitrospinae bacterium]|jgi:7-carboxy-7-deazaguanine synthase|nr:radical SAM protein [Nitrospinota bacterium]MDA1109769.1 radical SAM protein [Nitrospinota bacterium]